MIKSVSNSGARRRPAWSRTKLILAAVVATTHMSLLSSGLSILFTMPSTQNQLQNDEMPRSRSSIDKPNSLLSASGMDKTREKDGHQWFERLQAGALASLAAVLVGLFGPSISSDGVVSPGPQAAYASRELSTGSGSKVNRDPISLLQIALPLEETLSEDQVKPVRALQKEVESIRSAALLRSWDSAAGYCSDIVKTVDSGKEKLLKPIAASRREKAEAVLQELKAEIPTLLQALSDAEKAGSVKLEDDTSLNNALKSTIKLQELVGKFEEQMIPPDYVPKIPKEYDNLPRLIGRATVEMTLKRGPNSGAKTYAIDSILYDKANLKFVLDGWSSPLSAGNFVDLVDRGFYNGMEIQRADGLFIQSGDPGNVDEHGFRVAPGEKVRRIPLEVSYKGRKETIYGETIDESRLVGSPVRIPFQADGTISMARAEFDNDSASSQWFLFLFDSDMTPGGKNFIDGRYGSFGYCVEGSDFLRKIVQGDVIESIKILDGAENLKKI